MDERELRDKADKVKSKMIAGEYCDAVIKNEIEKNPELVHVILPATTNLFVEAVNYNYFEIARKLMEYGSDIHLCCRPSLFKGNALNVAKTPEMAEWLLKCGVEIEKNLSQRNPFVNPVIHAVSMNNVDMAFYWLKKETELFCDDETYIADMFIEVSKCAVIMNQEGMIARIMEDEKLYYILKKLYLQETDETSIKLYSQTLRKIKVNELQGKKKELSSILRARKSDRK
ncbi:hypothetical protein SAMN02745136_03806 [Anaerocolumna jejuensis DSM 15929]|uniref:Ankyrin repeat-containing protein n=1 Tax=Anaerocolumna jejuensis DSM 15929 TaxID=1121322 RepID=A0A1M6WYH4_9FIRM|nr:hypothetical protein [Anaerocolumna jejuensis]SHK98615.1 hypothetical protein SAMN02745136_03806 [Anaerocolumna jejuensis DSM 15929]